MHKPEKNPFVAFPVSVVSLPKNLSGVFDIKFLTLLIPSSVFIINPLIISTDLLTFLSVGSSSVFTIVVVSSMFLVSFYRS